MQVKQGSRIALMAVLGAVTLIAFGCSSPNNIEATPLDWNLPTSKPPSEEAWPEFPTIGSPSAEPTAEILKQTATTQVLSGDEYDSCHAAAISDAEAHSLTLDAAATPCCWGVYRFTGIPDVANNLTLRVMQDSDTRTHCWIGLADFQAESWRWTRTMGYTIIKPLIPPGFYANESAEIYIAIATEQDNLLEILSLSLDVDTPPQLLCSIPSGTNVPVTLTLDASASYDPDGGNIVNFAWDWEGDGTYVSSGSYPLASKFCPATGQMRVGVLISDDEGSSACEHYEIDLTGWQNYYSSSFSDLTALKLLARPDGRMIVFGYSMRPPYLYTLLMLELLPDGAICNGWQVETGIQIDCADAALDDQGNLYLIMGLYEHDLEIIKIDPEWNVAWGANWRMTDVYRPKWHHVKIHADDTGNLIACGYCFADQSALYFIKMDGDGYSIAAREYSTSYSGQQTIDAVLTSWNESVIICYAHDLSISTWFTFLTKLDAGGDPVAARRFVLNGGSASHRPYGVARDDEDRIYISGKQGSESILISCDTTGAGASGVSWNEPEYSSDWYRIIVSDVKSDKLYACSRVKATDLNYDFAFHELSTDGTILRSALVHGWESALIFSMLDDNKGNILFAGSSVYDARLWLPAHCESHPVDLQTSDMEINELDSSLAMRPKWWNLEQFDYDLNSSETDREQFYVGMACVDGWPPAE